MPPKKKNTAHEQQKLRDKRKKEAEKKAKDTLIKRLVPKPHFLPPAPKAPDILRTGAEETKMREIFKLINETPIADIDNFFDDFVMKQNLDKSQKRFLRSFQLSLPTNLYKVFAQEYLASNMSYKKTWDYFVRDPDNIAAIQAKQDKEEEEQTMKDRMVDIFGESSDDEDEEEDKEEDKGEMLGPIVDPANRTGRKTKLVWKDDEGWITADIPKDNKTKYYSAIDDTCIKEFTNYPWVSSDAKVKSVFIRSIEETDISPYISDNQISFKSITYYKTNREFKNLLCQRFFKQEQEGNVLVLTSKQELENIKLKFEVLFMLNKPKNKLIIQDEAIMDAQKNYFRQLRLTREDKIAQIRLRPINEEVKEIGMKYLSEKLHKVAPGVLDYGIFKIDSIKYDTDFIKQIILKITKTCHNIECFFDRIAEIVVYLNIENIGQGIYRKRIKQEYYTPDVLVDLTHKEKLPEFFIHGVSIDPEQSAQINKIIEVKKIEIVQQLLSDVYNLESPGERKPTRSSYGIVSLDNEKFKTDWKVYCSHPEDVKDVDDEDIIHYFDNEDGKIYCFDIRDIMMFVYETGRFKNPRTQRYVSQAFIEQIQSTFHIKPKEEVSDKKHEDDYSSDEQLLSEKPLAKGLLELIIKNIEDCENEIKEENLNSQGKCHSHDGADESESESESESDDDKDGSSSKEPLLQEDKPESVPTHWEEDVLSTPEEKEIIALKTKFGDKPPQEKFYQTICHAFKDVLADGGSTCIDGKNTQNMELFLRMDINDIRDKLNLYKVKYSETDDNKKLLRKFVKHIDNYQIGNFQTSQGFCPEQGDGKMCANPECGKIISDNKSSKIARTYFTKNGKHYLTSFCCSQCVSETKFGSVKQSKAGGRNGAKERNK